MTLSVKPEVHNVLQCRQRREDQALALGNMHKNLVKFCRAFFELCEQTDMQTNWYTNRHTHHSTLHPTGTK